MQNSTKAFELCTQAVAMGNLAAMVELGKAYEEGMGVKKDEVKALSLYQQAMEKGSALAESCVANCFAEGKGGVPRDEKRAMEIWCRLSDAGLADAQFHLGVMHYMGRQVKANDFTAAQLFEKATTKGHADAMSTLAGLYYTGKGVVKNEEKAAALWRQAGEAGNPEGYFHLGRMCERANNLPHSTAMYKLAAQRGLAHAQFKLALAYEKGKGIDADLQQAARWYALAAEHEATKALAQEGLKRVQATKT